MKKNESLKRSIVFSSSGENSRPYVPKPLDLSEYKTRKIYIDSMLIGAGWTEGKRLD